MRSLRRELAGVCCVCGSRRRAPRRLLARLLPSIFPLEHRECAQELRAALAAQFDESCWLGRKPHTWYLVIRPPQEEGEEPRIGYNCLFCPATKDITFV